MLSIATAGFVIPFERLRAPSKEPHPSQDRSNFTTARENLDNLLNLPFLGSSLWDRAEGSWAFAKRIAKPELDPDYWEELKSPPPVSPEKKNTSILKHLRNALSHGNVFTTGNPIKRIIFLSKPCEDCPFSALVVSPEDFQVFLINWLDFLRSLEATTAIVQPHVYELFDAAA